MKNSVIFFSFFLFLTSFDTAGAASLDCAGGIISDGDTRAEVLAKCGQPGSKEFYEEEVIDRLDRNSRRKVFITVEEWSYDFGTTRFTRIVTIKNGRVSDIRSGEYGHGTTTSPVRHECTEQVVSIGDAKSEVLAQCGEPFLKDSHLEELSERFGDGRTRRVFVQVEEWTYNLGPNRFVRILTFKNGKLTEIKTGGYGYDLKQDEKKR